MHTVEVPTMAQNDLGPVPYANLDVYIARGPHKIHLVPRLILLLPRPPCSH